MSRRGNLINDNLGWIVLIAIFLLVALIFIVRRYSGVTDIIAKVLP